MDNSTVIHSGSTHTSDTTPQQTHRQQHSDTQWQHTHLYHHSTADTSTTAHWYTVAAHTPLPPLHSRHIDNSTLIHSGSTHTSTTTPQQAHRQQHTDTQWQHTHLYHHSTADTSKTAHWYTVEAHTSTTTPQQTHRKQHTDTQWQHTPLLPLHSRHIENSTLIHSGSTHTSTTTLQQTHRQQHTDTQWQNMHLYHHSTADTSTTAHWYTVAAHTPLPPLHSRHIDNSTLIHSGSTCTSTTTPQQTHRQQHTDTQWQHTHLYYHSTADTSATAQWYTVKAHTPLSLPPLHSRHIDNSTLIHSGSTHTSTTTPQQTHWQQHNDTQWKHTHLYHHSTADTSATAQWYKVTAPTPLPPLHSRHIGNSTMIHSESTHTSTTTQQQTHRQQHNDTEWQHTHLYYHSTADTSATAHWYTVKAHTPLPPLHSRHIGNSTMIQSDSTHTSTHGELLPAGEVLVAVEQTGRSIQCVASVINGRTLKQQEAQI